MRVYRQLERVSPIEHYVDPVAALAGPTVRGISAVDLIAKSEVIAGLAYIVTQITRVVPQDTWSNAHARTEKIKKIPFPKQNTTPVKLPAIDRAAARRGLA